MIKHSLKIFIGRYGGTTAKENEVYKLTVYDRKSLYLSIYLSAYLSIYLSIYVYTTVTIPTFMISGIPRKDKMRNSGKLDHSGILKIQRIYLCLKIADLIFYSQELSLRFQGT